MRDSGVRLDLPLTIVESCPPWVTPSEHARAAWRADLERVIRRKNKTLIAQCIDVGSVCQSPVRGTKICGRAGWE